MNAIRYRKPAPYFDRTVVAFIALLVVLLTMGFTSRIGALLALVFLSSLGLGTLIGKMTKWGME